MTSESIQRPWRFWLVRHAETAWNAEGRFWEAAIFPSQSMGNDRHDGFRSSFRGEISQGVYASDLLRAKQTAETLTGLPIESSELWRELSFGDWEGLTYREICDLPESDLRFFTDSQRYAPPGGETLSALSQRVQQGFAQVMHALERIQPDQEVVLVSHAGPLQVLLCHLLHVPLAYHWQFQLAPGSYSALDISRGETGMVPVASLALLNRRPSEEEMQGLL